MYIYMEYAQKKSDGKQYALLVCLMFNVKQNNVSVSERALN